MADLNSIALVDGTNYPLAEYFNKLFGGVLRAEYANIQTITGTKQLSDADFQIQALTASGANRDVKLAPEASTNHIQIVYNNGASNNLVVKDDSGGTTFATLTPGDWCFCIPMAGLVWKVLSSTLFSAATSSSAGAVELATIAETTTGTDATRAVTPDSLAGSVYGTRYILLTFADPNTTPSTGDAQAHCVIPPDFNGYDIVSVLGAVTTVSSSGLPTMALRRLRSGSAVDVLSTNVTIDTSEYTSATAATPPAINTSNDDLQTGDILLVDLDTVGTGAKGHQLLVGVRLP